MVFCKYNLISTVTPNIKFFTSVDLLLVILLPIQNLISMLFYRLASLLLILSNIHS